MYTRRYRKTRSQLSSSSRNRGFLERERYIKGQEDSELMLSQQETPDLQTDEESAKQVNFNILQRLIDSPAPAPAYPAEPAVIQPKLTLSQLKEQNQPVANFEANQVMSRLAPTANPQPIQRQSEEKLEPVVQHYRESFSRSVAERAAVPTTQQETPDLQAQLERAERFGHNFGRVQVNPRTASVIQPQLEIDQPGDMYQPVADLDIIQQKSTSITSSSGETGYLQRKMGDGHDLTSPRFAGDPVLEACFDNEKLLKVGASGTAVEKIQQALIEAGFALPKFGADGKFGSETQTALKDFQRASGFGESDIDGIIGPKTMSALDARFGTETTPAGPTPAEPTPAEPTPSGEAPEIDEKTKKKQEALKILEDDASGPWANLSWEAVKAGTQQRVENPHLIDQVTSSLCGPATIVDALADTDPVEYAKFVRKIFTEAKVNGTEVGEDLLNATPASDMDASDWMVLSAMRDAENAIFDYEGRADEQFPAITMPGEMAEWMEDLLGCVDTAQYNSYLWGEIDNAEKVNSLLSSYGDKVIVAMLVNANRLQNMDSGADIPDHWIRLLSPIDIQDDTVSFTAFTWGGGAPKSFSFKRDDSDAVDFEDVLFEFVVGAKDKDIDL